MNIMKQKFRLETELYIWRLYKHFPRTVVDNMDVKNVATFLLDNLNYSSNEENIKEVSEKFQNIREYKIKLDALNAMPKIDQRTDEWYRLRQERLTGSDTAQALGRGKYGNRNQLIKKKATEGSNSGGYSASSPPLRHGVMFEAMALRSYRQRIGDIVVHDFGLIPHPTLYCYGASPDGINDIGVMVEIKCPYSRVIDGTIPEQYKLQMLGQMAVCSLKECDYIECDIKEYDSIQEYVDSVFDRIDHGVIFEIKEADKVKYIYSPEYANVENVLKWTNEQKIIYEGKIKKICPWKLNKIEVQRVTYDEELWNEIVPEIKSFWEEVLEARKIAHKKYSILEDPDD